MCAAELDVKPVVWCSNSVGDPDFEHSKQCGVQWKPTSAQRARLAEAQILRALRAVQGIEVSEADVPVNDTEVVHTLRVRIVPKEPYGGEGTPVLALHGMAGGCALWVKNCVEIATACRGAWAYFIDLPGFGRSSRVKRVTKASKDEQRAADAEEYYVSRFEAWRVAVNEEKLQLVGHSFGGYLAACYTLRHPSRVHRIVLCDAWGVATRPEDAAKRVSKAPWYVKGLASIAEGSGPLFALRAAGPFGPKLLPRFRPDLLAKWEDHYKRGEVADYIYQSNAQSPASGEEAFMALHIPFGWARYPLIERLGALPSHVSVHVLVGSKTWMDKDMGKKLADTHSGTYDVVPEAGHHIYIDNVEFFNTTVAEYLSA